MIENKLKQAKTKDIKRIITGKIIQKLGDNYLDDYVLGLMSDENKAWLLDIKTKQTIIISDLNTKTTQSDIDGWNTFEEISKQITILEGA